MYMLQKNQDVINIFIEIRVSASNLVIRPEKGVYEILIILFLILSGHTKKQ